MDLTFKMKQEQFLMVPDRELKHWKTRFKYIQMKITKNDFLANCTMAHIYSNTPYHKTKNLFFDHYDEKI